MQPPPPRRVGGRESNHSQPTHPIHTSHTYSYLSGRWPVGRHLHHLQAVQFKELGSGRRRGTAHAGQLAVEAKKYLRVLPQGAGVWSSCLLNPNYRVYRVITPTSGHFITVILLGRASLRPMTRWPPSPSSPPPHYLEGDLCGRLRLVFDAATLFGLDSLQGEGEG